MQHALINTPKGLKLIREDGSEVVPDDTDTRVLHLLPKLFVSNELLSVAKVENIELAVESSLNVPLLPEGGIVIRQPYPNRRHFVAGSQDIRVGWIIPLPEDVSTFTLTFTWKFKGCFYGFDWTVRHEIDVTLLPGTSQTYSMDVACWPPTLYRMLGAPPMALQPVSIPEIDDGYSPQRHIQDVGYLRAAPDNRVIGTTMSERFEIPCTSMSYLWTIAQFSHEQIHEVKKQSVSFSQFNTNHQANSCIRIPPELFVAAVKTAQKVGFGEASIYQSDPEFSCEDHPAILTLCNWWNSHAPDDAHRQAGTFIPWVRIRDDGEYWCGYQETPCSSIESFADFSNSAGSVGDFLLVLFFGKRATFPLNNAAMTIKLASGVEYVDVIAPLRIRNGRGHDEALFTLDALVTFPSRFPAAWDELNRLAALATASVRHAAARRQA